MPHLAPGPQILRERALELRDGETPKGPAELPIFLRNGSALEREGESVRRRASLRAPYPPGEQLPHPSVSPWEGTGSRPLKEFHQNSKAGLCVPNGGPLTHLHQLWIVPQYSPSHLLIVLEKVIGQRRHSAGHCETMGRRWSGGEPALSAASACSPTIPPPSPLSSLALQTPHLCSEHCLPPVLCQAPSCSVLKPQALLSRPWK